MKRCPVCNTTYGDEQNFCLNDGSSLASDASGSYGTATPTENLPYGRSTAQTERMPATPTAPPTSPYMQPVMHRRNPLPWILGGVALLVGIVVVIIFATRGQNSSGTTGSSGGALSGFKQENSAANLKALFQELHKAMSSNDTKTAAAIARGLLPDESRVRKALRDDVPADTVKQIMVAFQGVPTADEKSLARVFAADPANTEVQVHSATTEEISRYTQGSEAFNEFPGGARQLAGTILRPNTTFYEVEFLKPGNDLGMKYHLFFWDGTQWTMLGPAWRALR